MMSAKSVVTELQNCNKELQKQKRLKKLRKIVQPILINMKKRGLCGRNHLE
jgi:hypothetical protein